MQVKGLSFIGEKKEKKSTGSAAEKYVLAESLDTLFWPVPTNMEMLSCWFNIPLDAASYQGHGGSPG